MIAEAKLPTPQEVAENSGHWTVAVSALVRAVLLDGVPVSDPAIAGVAELLAPVVWDELAAADDVDKDFPDTQGPRSCWSSASSPTRPGRSSGWTCSIRY